MKLLVNMLVQFAVPNSDNVRVERILWVDISGGHGYTIDIFSNQALPQEFNIQELETFIEGGEAHLLEHDPYQAQASRPERTISEKHRQMRDKRWHVIAPMLQYPAVFDAQTRAALVHAGKQKISRVTVYKLLRLYWQRGQTTNTLLPNYERSGAPGKIRLPGSKKRGRPRKIVAVNPELAGRNIDEKARELIVRGLKHFYEVKGLSFNDAFRKTLLRDFSVDFETKNGQIVPTLPPVEQLPTVAQARYWYQQSLFDLKGAIVRREGERAFNLTARPILGDSTQTVLGPGSVYQIDATVGDIYLVSMFDRSRIIGRPVIYLVIDVFSRMIVGMTVLLEGPSWVGGMSALENAMTDKVEFCREHGIEIAKADWPVHYAPASIIADRGELEGFNADNITYALKITLSNTPPYRADWKGIVEQHFRLLNIKGIRFLPGSLRGAKKRGGPDYRLDACLNLVEFRQILIHIILRHNNSHKLESYTRDEFMVAEHVPLFPRDLWEWGIQYRSGILRKIPRDVLRLNLLVQDRASVTEKGIYFKGLYYDCALAHAEQWYVRARSKGRWFIPVAYDPRSVRSLFLSLDNGQRVEACQLLEKSKTFSAYSHYDIAEQFFWQHEEVFQAQQGELQAEGELDAEIKAIAESAQEAAKQAQKGQSQRQRTLDIRANRQQERDAFRNVENWGTEKPTSTDGVNPVPANQSLVSTDTEYIPPPNYTSDIARWQRKDNAPNG